MLYYEKSIYNRMNKMTALTHSINTPMTPDFELIDMHNETVRLSDYQGKKHVILVFNRGFM